ncbi:transposase [Saccharopolyspora phatthalungensis]|uniref:Transposase n=1 Tax=Saccharopolyspora phatthalungensis TaxID=664693 RepID=A0A840PQE6_9PSEU|nr:transposase [Saccharopolyspora phatthalungensis]
MRLFVGDDWAEDHHDIELMDTSGRRLAKARPPEGVVGMARLHAMIGNQVGEEPDEDVEVVIGIETDRGPWVAALVAAGYTVMAVNPLQAAEFRRRLGVSGAKSDAGDAHVPADMVRTHSHELRPVAGDSAEAEAIKVVARTHKTLIWERTRHTQRLRHALRDYFPAALVAFEDLDAADTLELLAKAPIPAKAARLTLPQINAALKRARRRDIAEKATAIQAALRAEHLGQPEVVADAYAASIQALIAVLTVLNTQITALQGQVQVHFGQHPAAPDHPLPARTGRGVRCPGARRVRGRPPPLRLRQIPQELRGHVPDHPRVGQEESRPGPVHPQRPAHRRTDDPGVRRAESLARSPGLLRPTSPRLQPQRRPASTRQPTRRHPPRMPQDRHPLRRDDCLVASRRERCGLTFQLLGCLSRSAGHYCRAGSRSLGVPVPAGRDSPAAYTSRKIFERCSPSTRRDGW